MRVRESELGPGQGIADHDGPEAVDAQEKPGTTPPEAFDRPIGGPSPLFRYLLAAALVRTADGGAAVGLLLLSISWGARIGNATAIGGVLAALLTAPHLFGPLLARRLDRGGDNKWLLALAFAVFGCALGGAALLLGRAPLPIICVLVAIAGLCGPMLTGGLSSRLAFLAGESTSAQRRAQGGDAATYGLAGTLGPTAVAGLAAIGGPAVAVLVLSGAAMLASLVVLTLPGTVVTDPVEPMPLREAVRAIVTTGPLRRVMTATLLTALGAGGLTVIAVVLGRQLGAGPSGGAVLAACFGFGNLAGALTLAAFPLRGEPERLTIRFVAVTALLTGLCAVAPTFVLALVLFACTGAGNALLFTAGLAVRSTYSPAGGRAQIFVAMAGLKMAGSSAGTALAGALMGFGPRALLSAAAVVTVLAAVVATVDRRLSAEKDKPWCAAANAPLTE